MLSIIFMPDYSKDLIAASSIPLILSVLSKQESYGYEIIRTIREASNKELEFAEGTIYPILKKMEEKKLIISKWKKAKNDRERKYYRLTSYGRKQLSMEKNNWSFINSILQSLWQPQTLSSSLQLRTG